jgi:hypothetical protein
MRSVLIFCFLLSSINCFSQAKVLNLNKTNTEQTIQIKEHKRIKIQTFEGKTFYGRLAVIDSASLMIKENLILIKDIKKVRQKSLFSTIANPIFIIYGSAILVSGVLVAGTGGFGVVIGGVLVITSIPMILIPAIVNNHDSEKWNYSIQIE